jgi:hypothetical protein
VIGLLSRDDRSIHAEREVNTRIRHQVGLEFSKINVQSTIESEGNSDGGNALSGKSVQVGVGRSLDFKVSSAHIVQGFVINHEGDIGVFQHSVSAEHGVVGFNNSSGNLRRGVDSELNLGLLAVVDRETFKEEGTETGTSTTTERVEDHESLETSAVISKLSDSVQYKVNNFLADGVVTTSIVVGGIFLAGDELFRVEELAVGTSSNFIDDSGF